MGYVFIALTVLCTVYGQLVIKWQVSRLGALPADAYGKLTFLAKALLNPWIVSGLAAAFVASLFWMLALSKLPLSTAYPYTAASFVLVLVFAALLLSEPISLGKLLGTALIVAGVALLAWKA